MNSLEPLISILKIKPIVNEHSQVSVLIKGEFLDERENEFDMETLMKRLADAKLTKVVIKPTSVREEEVIQPNVEPEKTLITKKVVGKKGKLIIEEDEGEEQGPGIKVVLPKKTERKTRVVEKAKEIEI